MTTTTDDGRERGPALDEGRLEEIRYWLSTGENADPSCLDCNEHVMLSEIDRLRALVAAQGELMAMLRAAFRYGDKPAAVSGSGVLSLWANDNGTTTPNEHWSPESVALWNALKAARPDAGAVAEGGAAS